jgi:hypothetical protein
MTKKHYVSAGDTVRIQIGHSEAACHCQIAGKVLNVRLGEYCAYPVYDGGEGPGFTYGELGIYRDSDGAYCYPVAAEARDYKLWLYRHDAAPHWRFYDRVVLTNPADYAQVQSAAAPYKRSWALTDDADALVTCQHGLVMGAIQAAIQEARR